MLEEYKVYLKHDLSIITTIIYVFFYWTFALFKVIYYNMQKKKDNLVKVQCLWGSYCLAEKCFEGGHLNWACGLELISHVSG